MYISDPSLMETTEVNLVQQQIVLEVKNQLLLGLCDESEEIK